MKSNKLKTQIFSKLFIIPLILMALFGFSGSAYAITPSLSLYATSSGSDTVNLTTTGDPNSSVYLYYYNNSSILQNRFLGTTNSGGYFTTTLSASNYGIIPSSTVYVTVNNQQSSSTTWPYTSGSSYYGSLSLSQNSLPLNVGQSSSVSAYNYYSYGTLYVSSNSNPNVVSVSVSGGTIYFYGLAQGSSTVTICQSGSYSSCGTVYVSVSGYGYGNNYYPNNYNSGNGLNISSLSIPLRGSLTFSSTNGAGLYVSNNSNPSVVSATYNSGVYPVYGSSSYYPYSSSIPGCNPGASYSVTTGQPCYGNYGYNNYPYYGNTYYGNNNTTVTLTALRTGTSTITVCPNSNQNYCSTVYVSVIN